MTLDELAAVDSEALVGPYLEYVHPQTADDICRMIDAWPALLRVARAAKPLGTMRESCVRGDIPSIAHVQSLFDDLCAALTELEGIK